MLHGYQDDTSRRVQGGGRCVLEGDVLAAAHDKGIVHRDIKPLNVFLCPERVKLVDFGIARVLDGASRTKTGEILGTPAFMAPEQAGGRTRDIDARTDVWATGALMFTLLTGEDVHAARGGQAQLVHAATQPARPIGPLVRDLPADVQLVIDTALAFDSAERWQNAHAMRTALRTAAPRAA